MRSEKCVDLDFHIECYTVDVRCSSNNALGYLKVITGEELMPFWVKIQ